MNPLTHLLIGWEIGCASTTNQRERTLITCASIAPDIDGIGLFIDAGSYAIGSTPTHLYATYHHSVLHGLLGGLLVLAIATAFSHQKLRTTAVAAFAFHLHLVCDVLGSAGPQPGGIWPIRYLAPFSESLSFSWSGQWPVNGWPNIAITALFIALLIRRTQRERVSPFIMVSKRANHAFVSLIGRFYEHRKSIA